MNQYVHVNCAMWTSEVQEGTEEVVVSSELYNFFFAFRQFRHHVCSFCGLKGATLLCCSWQHKKCSAAYHFPCAYQSGKVAFLDSIEIMCELCTKRDREAVLGLPEKFKNYHRRRVVIVKNI